MAQSNTKKLKTVTCMAHLLFFWGLGINSWFISYLSPSSASTGTGKNHSTMAAGSQDIPGLNRVQGQAQEQGALPEGALLASYCFIRSCPSASARLPLLRHTHTDTVVN